MLKYTSVIDPTGSAVIGAWADARTYYNSEAMMSSDIKLDSIKAIPGHVARRLWELGITTTGQYAEANKFTLLTDLSSRQIADTDRAIKALGVRLNR